MGRYLDIARRLGERIAPLQGSEDNPTSVPKGGGGAAGKDSPESSSLLAAGWKPKVRCDNVIWASPRSGFWYSQEIALELLRLDEGLSSRSAG